MTYAIAMLELSDAQLGAIAFADPFLALCVTFGLGTIIWGRS